METLLKEKLIMIELDEKKGRSLTSTHQRNPGDVIIQDTAIAICVIPEYEQSTCYSCMCSPHDLLKCSVCKRARYCDRECQKRDWSLHSAECDISFSATGEKNIPTLLLLLIRLLKKNQNILKSRRQQGDTFCDEIQLMGSQENIPEITKEMFSQYVQLVMVRLNGKFNFSSQLVYRALEKLYTNTFSVLTEELVPKAVAVYSVASLLNHSCRPNCVQHFSGRQITIRAIERVAAGDELTVSYIDIIQGIEERRYELLKGYLFKCECNTCLEEYDRPMVPNTNSILLREIIESRKLLEWKNILETTNSLFDCKQKADYETVRILEQIMDAHIELGNWKEAMVSGKKLSIWYTEIGIANNYPCVVINTVKLAKLLLQLDCIEEAMEYIERGMISVKLCYGEGIVYRNIREMYSITRMEIIQKNSSKN
ncbi:Histone-lysine N-methyltransferase SMYD3 [Oopsacas minuta]|uniref:Histone-lysine N-methyltransferase SMYD3 n=1 Tax=Oopsacas minuta TaxID=111878 RepID=A0AAV7KIZ9_9METZ|nr:Histone-lysine N-methyltransferase SMYD3 [Oopsacas minuta]